MMHVGIAAGNHGDAWLVADVVGDGVSGLGLTNNIFKNKRRAVYLKQSAIIW